MLWLLFLNISEVKREQPVRKLHTLRVRRSFPEEEKDIYSGGWISSESSPTMPDLVHWMRKHRAGGEIRAVVLHCGPDQKHPGLERWKTPQAHEAQTWQWAQEAEKGVVEDVKKFVLRTNITNPFRLSLPAISYRFPATVVCLLWTVSKCSYRLGDQHPKLDNMFQLRS
ncbi:hypothetical protein llap_10571 [Limosa lapponica baueri]|uniref:Uncharacterized protein n=1 Tax=Limosa lapponica baueri TaxID=1758121 RepID=A0A2I0TZ72_LIMLA|nr:hypothetical protein llap_10571 [Limosa lapponica baueri]